MTRDDREREIKEIIRLRLEDNVYSDISGWIADVLGQATVDTAEVAASTSGQGNPIRAQRGIAGGSSNAPTARMAVITGTILVDMSDDQAAQLRRDLPNVFVLQDAPLDLIPPRRDVTTATHQITPSGLWHLQAIGLGAARGRGFQGYGTGVTIAVLDTGIDPTHPEMDGKVAEAFTFELRPDGWAAIPMIPPGDTDGHGTHVAGLLLGDNVGVAPGARVLSGVMLPQGKGNYTDFIIALEWAGLRADIQIVNVSAGLPGYLEEMRGAVADELATGIFLVFAVGNEGRNRTRSPGNYIEGLSVGAAAERSGKYVVPGFSGGGTLRVDHHQYDVPDLVAPGKGVYSSVAGGGYQAWDGTSMATPIVAGVAALILEKYPDITVLELEEELLSTCLDLGLPSTRQGRGLVQVTAAL